MATTALVFRSISFSPVHSDDNQIWLGSPQIAVALNYKRADRISEIYQRHVDEFTPSMTRLLSIKTNGGAQEVRVFSLRGAHLLAMFARTPVAKEFRRWTLDVLDKEVTQRRLDTLPLDAPPLEFPMPVTGRKYNRRNPYPRDGETIETSKEIAVAIRDWAWRQTPTPATRSLAEAADTLHDLLITGWTEVDEALGSISHGMHYLNRWQGRGGRMGNVGP
jgi:hypothetical protein